MTARGRRIAAGVLVLTAPLAACTGGSGGSAPSSSTGSAAAAAARVTTWWPDGADYCGVLRATVHGGRSILPDLSADDPARLAATQAFVAEVRRTAPSSVAGAWQILGTAVVDVVRSGGHLRDVHGVDPSAVRRAATEIAADAKRTCHLDLSAAAR